MINNLTVAELPFVLEAEGEKTLLIDVREPFEFSTCRIPGSKLMPLSGVLVEDLQLLPNSIEHWIFVCQHGIRSKKAAEIAEALGKNISISHVVGGVAAWAAVNPLHVEAL